MTFALPTDVSALESAISDLVSKITILEGRSGSWEKVLPFFTLVVVVGLLADVAFLFWDRRDEMEDWRRGTVHSPERPSTRKFILGLIGAILIFLGVAGELWAGAAIASINGQLRSKNAELRTKSDQLLALVTQEAGDASARAATAFEHAAKTEKEAAQLREQAEAERLARVKIEAAVAWRSLDDKQKRDIASALRRFGYVTDVSIWYVADSPEAELFAGDIAEALRLAHIHTTTPGGMMEMREGGGNWDAPITPTDTGVEISSTQNPVARDLASALLKEMSSRGFDARRQADQPQKDNKPPDPVVWVTVQGRPRGPQGEYKLQVESEARQKGEIKSQ